MSFLSEAFGRSLKTLRLERGLNQEDFGAAQNTVSRWESGEFIPGDKKIDEILEILKVDKETFMREMLGEKNPTIEIALVLKELKSIPVLVAYEKAEPDIQKGVRLSLGLEPIGRAHLETKPRNTK